MTHDRRQTEHAEPQKAIGTCRELAPPSATRWKVFLAGVMQGSMIDKGLVPQDYRGELKRLLRQHLPEADVYDPLADHKNSLEYDRRTGREVFFFHNEMCRTVDLLIAYLPQASMGTAIEMWEAYRHGAVVLSISPMRHNWVVKFLSHRIYPDLDAFKVALESGEIRQLLQDGVKKGSRGP